MKAAVKSYFLVPEVEHFTGLSKYMLDYLVREDIFLPSASTADKRGVRRQYSYADVVFLRALSEICRAKGRIRHLRKSLLNLRMTVGPLRPGMRLDRLLFVDANDLCLRTSGEGAVVLRSGQMVLAAFVDLAEVTSRISEGIIVEREGLFRLTDEAQAEAEKIRRANWERVRKARLLRKFGEQLEEQLAEWG
jgi:DNA-binding transcriptional MerR regulator